MMYEKAQQEMYTSSAEWLKNHYLAKNNLAAALERLCWRMTSAVEWSQNQTVFATFCLSYLMVFGLKQARFQ